ncbi:MAG: PAS domain S-box protein [Chitinophagales bacterium]|nr:PAS domain S-box protein [Chitinophagales bacterium]
MKVISGNIGPYDPLARWLSLAALVMAVLIIAAYAGYTQPAALLFSNWYSMKFNAALCVIFAAVAVITLSLPARFRWLSILFTIPVFVLSLLTGLSHFQLSPFLVTDQWFMSDPYVSGGAAPGRMTIFASAALFLLAAILFLRQSGKKTARWVADSLSALLVLFIMVILAGYYSGISSLGVRQTIVPVSLPTVLSVLLLAVGLFISGKDTALLPVFANRSAAARARTFQMLLLILLFFIAWWVMVPVNRFDPAFDPNISMGLMMVIILSSYLIIHVSLSIQLAKSEKGQQALHASLEKSEAFTRGILSSISSCVGVIDQQGVLVEVNRAWVEFGARNGVTNMNRSAAGSNYFEVCAAAAATGDEYAAKALQGIRQVLSGQSAYFELQYPCHSPSQQRWFTLRVMPLQDGKPLAVVAHHEITELVMVQQQLQQREQQLKQVMDNTRELIWSVDAANRLLLFNKSFEQEFIHFFNHNPSPGIFFYQENDARIPVSWISHFNAALRGESQQFEQPYEINGEQKFLDVGFYPAKKGNSVEVIHCFAKDITARKMASLQLQESERRFRTIFETEPSCVKLLNRENQLWDINPAGLQLIEADSIGQVIGKPVLHLLLPEYRTAFLELTEKVFAGEPGSLEYEIRGLKGTRRWMEMHAVPMKDADSDNNCILAISHDITIRKQFMQELSRNEKKYRFIVERNLAGIYQTSQEGSIITCNRSFARMLGYDSPEELLGMNAAALYYQPADRAHFIKDLFASRELNNYELRLRHKDGSPVDVIENCYLHEDITLGKIIEGVMIDISGRKKTEEELKSSERKFRNLLESGPDAMVIVNEQGAIVMVNHQAELLFGYPKKELLHLKVEMLLPENYRLSHQGHRKQYTHNPKVRPMGKSLDLLARKKDNSLFPAEISLSPIKSGDGMLVTAAIRDVTDRKRAEQELEESYRSVRQLTEHLQLVREEEQARISREIHDELGQRLTVLMMDIHWIDKKLAGQFPDVSKKITEVISMLGDTTRSVRKISMELRPSVLDELGLAAAMEDHLADFGRRAGMAVHFRKSQHLSEFSTLVKNTVYRIFQESLTNIARHSGASVVNVSLTRNNNQLVLKITDNGKGFIPPVATQKRTLGILGMKERAVAAGGTVEIFSKVGEGTKVEARIPI